jgi:hypothetical protein
MRTRRSRIGVLCAVVCMVGAPGYSGEMSRATREATGPRRAGDASEVQAGAVELPPAQRADVAEVLGVWNGDEGQVTWRVSSAWGTAGFFVYRIDPVSGVETRLNSQLVPVMFGQADTTYALADPAAREGGAGTYRLEEVEMSGVLLDLGVYTVVFVPPAPIPENQAPTLRAPSLRRDAPPPASTSSVLRVTLQKEGLYGVGLESIATGMGLPLEEVQNLAEADSICIQSQGRPVPTLHDAGRNRLVFHGQPTPSWYARDAAYLISVGEGCAMPRQDPGATNGATVVPVQLRIEEDRLPLDSVVQMPEDFYYWDYVISTTNPASNQVDFALSLDGYAGGALRLTVDVQGWSKTSAQNPDHHAEFSLNGTPVGTLAFDDQHTATAELSIPGGLASNGLNVLTVRGALPTNYTHSYFVVDGVTAEYDWSISPGPAGMYFQAGEATSLSAQAFTDPLVIALDWERWFPVWVADEFGELPGKAWAVAEGNEAFAVIEAGAVPMLDPEPAAADAWFMAETNEIDYLVIVSRALAGAAQELADYRAGQGYRVGVATFEDICDLLFDGLRDPEAIRELMSMAASAWPAPPQLAVLAGSGHYDYLGSLSNEVNHLPPMLTQTFDGFFASDELLGDCGGDDLPEVAIGRLPAQTAAELTAMIAKIKTYESEFGAAWQNEWTFAADPYDYLAGDFPGSNVRLADGVDSPYTVAMQFDLDSTPIGTARANWMGRFNAGSGFMHYTGHGSSTKYSSQGLMTTTDIQAMTNARPAVVVALCCLSGRFEAPGVNSMSEALLQRAGGGAVAAWASSGMSRNGPATDLAEAVYRDVIEEGSGTLGLSILRARRELPEDLFNRDTFATFNLMGDPALRIAGNTGGHPEPLAIAPVFAEVAAQSATVGVAMAFTVGATGAPPPVLALFATTATTGYVFSAETGQLTYTPTAGDIGLQTFSFTASNTAGQATQTVEVAVAAALQMEVSAGAIRVREAGEGRFYVRLTAAPTGTVVVGVSHHAGDTNLTVKTGAVRAFTPANWGTWQVVTLAAEPDANAVSETATFQLVAAGLETQLVAAATLDSDIGQNLALASGGAAITGTQANQLAQVIDGVHTSSANYGYTVWTNEPPGTMTLDLQVPATLSRVRVLGWDWNQRTHRYRIEASADGANWSVLADGSGEDRQGWDDWAAGAQEVRYLRYTGLTNSAGAIEALAEWEVYGQARTVPVASKAVVNVREGGEGRFFVRLAAAPTGTVVVGVSRSGGDTNLTVKSGSARVFTPTTWSTWQAVTLAAAEDGNTADETASIRISMPGEADRFVSAVALDDDLGQNLALASGGATIAGTQANQLGLLIDGVHTSSANYGYTVWTNEPPGTMTLDLQAPSTVSRVRILNWEWSHRTHRYRIESSPDGVSWTLRADASGEDRHGWDDWAVNAGSIRYLRYTGLTNSADRIEALVEWEVYGERPPLPQAEISKAFVNVREGGEGRFFVRLASAPAGNIVVYAAHSGGDTNVVVKSGSTRSFTPANWSIWQAVTLSAGEDGNSTDETAEIRISSPGVADQVVTAVALDDDLGQNLALASNGATITGWKANQMGQLIDGVHTSSANYGYTVWTNEPPGTMTLDLQAEATVTRMRLANWDWSHRTHRYQIECSLDATNWMVLADASGEDRQGWDDWAVTNGAMRYLRFTGLVDSSGAIQALVEWEVYGEQPVLAKVGRISSATPIKSPAVQPQAVAEIESESGLDATAIWPVTVVTSDGGPEDPAGWAAVDGDLETGWTGREGAGGWYIAIGYGETVVATHLAVEVMEGSATGMQCLFSLDGEEWTEWTEAAPEERRAFNYLWLLFTAEDASAAVPRVMEIRPEP